MKRRIGYIVFGIALACIIIAMVGRGIRIKDGFNVVSDFAQFEVEGAAGTDANPWNMTIGLIEENGEQYVFMVPGTALILEGIREYHSFQFEYQLYFNSTNGMDEMDVQSDGAGLSVIYYNKEGQVMCEDMIFIDSHAGGHSYVTLPETALSSYISSIEIRCNSGYYGDGILDWVLLQ